MTHHTRSTFRITPFGLFLASACVVAGTLAPGAAQSSADGAPAHTLVSFQWTAQLDAGGVEAPTDLAVLGGGAVVVGRTNGFGAGASDAWVARFDEWGDAVWHVAVGGANDDEALAVELLGGDGVVLVGRTFSYGAGGADGWIVELDGRGRVVREATIGTIADEELHAIAPSPNGFYLGGHVLTARDGLDVLVLEIDRAGNVLWQETFGGTGDETVTALAAVPGGVAVAASSSSQLAASSPISAFRPWLLRLDANGVVQWQRSYDLDGGNVWNDLIALQGGGFAVTGEALVLGFNRGDAWVMRLDAMGDVVWDRRFGDNGAAFWFDEGRRIVQRASGGFVVLGSTATAGPSDDVWQLEVAEDGTLVRSGAFGTSGFDQGGALGIDRHGVTYVAARVGGNGSSGGDLLVARRPADARGCLRPDATAPNTWTTTVPTSAPQASAVASSFVFVPSNATRILGATTSSLVCHRAGR